MSLLKYSDSVYKRLVDMDEKEIISFDESKGTPEMWNKFSEVVKQFIRDDYGKRFGFIIEFSSDYKRIRKIKLPSA